MKVTILKTGTVEEYEAGYAARLIEQGKAVPAGATEETTEETPQSAARTAPISGEPKTRKGKRQDAAAGQDSEG